MTPETTKDGYSKDYSKEHELMRRQLWIQAWSLTANANDCKSPDTATSYANKALIAFDKEFKVID